MPESFIDKRKSNWQRLEELLERIGSARELRYMSRDEVREFGVIYRRTAADLAIARVESRDEKLINYLNNLVIRAHGIIYRAESSGWKSIYNFYRYDFPELFRSTIRYTLTVIGIFLVIVCFSFIATWRSDDFAEHSFVGSNTVENIKRHHEWWKTLNSAAPLGAAQIITNNIQVGFQVFAFSILPILGTLLMLMPTSLQFGAINALAIKYGMSQDLWAFVMDHGVLEFSAMFIEGGAGLLIGTAILFPGDKTRRESLIERGIIGIKLMVGTLPLTIIAGMIEAFISPSYLPFWIKICISSTTAIILGMYLFRCGKDRIGQ